MTALDESPAGRSLAGALPAVEEVLATAHIVRVPLRVRFRGIDAREAVLLHGPAGWGEFAPFAEYDDAESAWWLASAIEAAWLPPVPARRDHVRVNATVPAVPAAQVSDVLSRFDGCRTVKVKVAEPGQSLADDLARVRAVREWLGDDGAIRADANGGWSVRQSVHALTRLAEFGLEYAEQPCATVAELIDLRDLLQRRGIHILIAADESIRKAADPLAVARAGAADVAVVKVAPLGGVRRLLALAQALTAHDVRLVVSSAIDTSVGLATGLQAAAALPDEPLASGLATTGLLADDVVAPPLRPHAGAIELRPVRPEPAALRRLSIDDSERAGWWRERVTRCHRLLEGALR